MRMVEYVRVRGKSPKVFADSDWGCHSFAAEVAVFGRRRTTYASAAYPERRAHLLEYPRVGDGRGKTEKQIWRDPEWCRKVVRFLRKR